MEMSIQTGPPKHNNDIEIMLNYEKKLDYTCIFTPIQLYTFPITTISVNNLKS